MAGKLTKLVVGLSVVVIVVVVLVVVLHQIVAVVRHDALIASVVRRSVQVVDAATAVVAACDALSSVAFELLLPDLLLHNHFGVLASTLASLLGTALER